MHYVIGTDEAGYGPNLGPLLISATCWQVPYEMEAAEINGVLTDVVCPTSAQVSGRRNRAVAIADSKLIYKPSGSLSLLEHGVLAMLNMGRKPLETWRQLWECIVTDATGGFPADIDLLPWYAGYDVGLPLDADSDDILEASQYISGKLCESGISLRAVSSKAAFPPHFNGLLDQYDKKSNLLSALTIGQVADMIRSIENRVDGVPYRVTVLCDKHGGRNKYRPILEEFFTDTLIEVHGETRELSVYRFGRSDRRIEIRFQMRGESAIPTALASMVSKYLRETAMQAFNLYWRRQCGESLKATAGYPVDAKRFLAEIESKLTQLGIERDMIWRKK